MAKNTIYFFDKTLSVIDFISQEKSLYNRQKAILNDTITHKIEVPYSQSTEEAYYFGLKDVDEPNNFLIYKTEKNITNNRGNIELTGIHKFFDDLKGRGYIKEREPHAYIHVPMGYALEGTGWNIGLNTVKGTTKLSFYYTNKLEAFYEIIEAYKAEFKLRIIFENGKITSQLVDLAPKFAEDRGRIYSYGDRLVTVEKEQGFSSIVTALTPKGKGEQVSSAEETGNLRDGYGRRIGIEDVEWSTAKGDPVDKPLGQEYIELPDATNLYGYADGSPRLDTITFGDIEDPNELIQAGYEALVAASIPSTQFKTKVDEERPVYLGEYVGIIRDEINLRYKTRVFETDRNFNNKTDKIIKFGDPIEYKRASAQKREFKKYENALNDLWRNTTHLITNEAGNTIFYSSDPNTEPVANREGDQWFLTYAHPETGKEEVRLLKWDGSDWVEALNTARIADVEFKVDQVEQEAQTALDNTSAQKTDITALQDRAGAIESDIVTKNTAIQDDIRAINTNLGGVKGDITGIRTNIESLQGELVETEPGTLAYKINEVDKTADGISASLGSYAKTTDLDGLASETYVNSQVTAKADELSLKMDDYALSTDLTGLATEEYAKTQARTEAGKVSGQLVNYAKKTDLTGLASETYVNTQVNVEAGRVDRLLQSYAKSSDLTGLATEEYARTQASAEAGKIEVQLTNYATKSYVDEIEVGGRNLLKGTQNFTSVLNLESSGVTTSVNTKSYYKGEAIKVLRLTFSAGTSDYVRFNNAIKEANTDYTFSCYIERIGYSVISYSFYVNGVKVNTTATSRTKWTKVEFTFTSLANISEYHYIEMKSEYTAGANGVWLSYPKLEKGNKATDWTPAPEDTATTTSLNSVKATADGNKSTISTIVGDNTVTAFNNKIETAYGDVQTLKQDLTVGGTTYTLIHETKTTADEHTSTIARLDSNIKDNSAHYQSLNESFNTFKRTVNETYLSVGQTNGNATSLKLTDGSILAGIVKDGRTNKLHLTDQYFYGGSKFITDHVEATYAEMDNLRVNNTIDASKVRVINLDALNITANKTSFVKSVWNSLSSVVEIQSTGLKMKTSQGWDAYLGASGLEFRAGATPISTLRASLGADGRPEGAVLVAEPGYHSGLGYRRHDGELRFMVDVDNSRSTSTSTDPRLQIHTNTIHTGYDSFMVRFTNVGRYFYAAPGTLDGMDGIYIGANLPYAKGHAGSTFYSIAGGTYALAADKNSYKRLN